ncbi:hypothetical protein DPMN_084253 [Dreissena polymorpha]|uniref:Uncharacterized protein n=1 Tax=Dreissena polymorpha TaxID=45954 RepID=A0A9D3YDH8_DREPO|nr:hypothetical protein DPMN_084253 [Dreissena polymorpha]
MARIEVLLKGIFGWARPMLVGPRDRPCCHKRFMSKQNFGWAWSMWARRHRVGNGARHKVQYKLEFQGSSANSVGGDSGQDGRSEEIVARTGGQTAEIITISPRF